MIAEAAHSRPGRPPRYQVAAGLVAAVVVLLVVSGVISSFHAGRLPGIISAVAAPVAGLVALATWFAVRAFDREPERRARHLVVAGTCFGLALLLWLLILELFLIGSSGPGVVLVSALACLPTTAFGLWAVRRLDRNEKEPWRLVLVAVAWGAIVAVSLVIWANTLLGEAGARALVPGPGLDALTAFGAGGFEEIAKGLAVLLLYLVMRDEFDGVVDGIVYGAAVGLGFNFMETLLYMSHMYATFEPEGMGGAVAGLQWYQRQVLSLFTGHATYSALVGAGIGVARQLGSRRQRLIAIAGGWLAAIAAHFAWDSWTAFFPIPQGPAALLAVHLRVLVMEGPFTSAVLVLLAIGLTVEGTALRRQLEAEAASGSGAVVPAEVPVLCSPWLRFRVRLAVFVRHGFGAYRRLRELQQAQLNLAMERWHRERQELDAPPAVEEELRRRILALRG